MESITNEVEDSIGKEPEQSENSRKCYCYPFIPIFDFMFLRYYTFSFFQQSLNWILCINRGGFDWKYSHFPPCVLILIVRKISKWVPIEFNYFCIHNDICSYWQVWFPSISLDEHLYTRTRQVDSSLHQKLDSPKTVGSGKKTDSSRLPNSWFFKATSTSSSKVSTESSTCAEVTNKNSTFFIPASEVWCSKGSWCASNFDWSTYTTSCFSITLVLVSCSRVWIDKFTFVVEGSTEKSNFEFFS